MSDFRHLILDNLGKLVVFSFATIHLIQILIFFLHSTNSKEHKQVESMIWSNKSITMDFWKDREIVAHYHMV